MEARFERAFLAYAVANPDRVRDFAERLMAISEDNRLPIPERTLGLREAARRIGIHPSTLLEDYHANRCGAKGPNGKPRFSEVDCEERKARRRTSGDRTK